MESSGAGRQPAFKFANTRLPTQERRRKPTNPKPPVAASRTVIHRGARRGEQARQFMTSGLRKGRVDAGAGTKKADRAKAIQAFARHDRLSTFKAAPRGGGASAPSVHGTQLAEFSESGGWIAFGWYTLNVGEPPMRTEDQESATRGCPNTNRSCRRSLARHPGLMAPPGCGRPTAPSHAGLHDTDASGQWRHISMPFPLAVGPSSRQIFREYVHV